MIYWIIWLIGLYLVYRIFIGIFIPKYSDWKIRKYKERFEKENPQIFNKDKEYTGRIHPSLKSFYKDDSYIEKEKLEYMEKFNKYEEENNK